MEWIAVIVALIVGAALGAGVAFLWARSRLTESAKNLEAAVAERDRARNEGDVFRSEREEARAQLAAANTTVDMLKPLEGRLEELRADLAAERKKLATLESQLVERERSFEQQMNQLKNAREELSNQFAEAAQKALKSNNLLFLDMANENLKRREQAVGELVKPVKETLEKLDQQNQILENKRVEAYASLQEQVKQLVEQGKGLQAETGNLVKALRAPQQRGRWGEIQLRRVVEMAGMVQYCDFEEQSVVDGGRLRPDMVIRLPNGRTIVVDSKTPLDGYLNAVQATDDDVRRVHLAAHARHVREHIAALSKKSYWEQFESAEFVVLFIPGEPIFGAALEQDPSLIEVGVQANVLIATPTTLISLLRAVAYGWQGQKLAENAKEIAEAGKELYKRVAKVADHFGRLTKNLRSTVESHNEFVASLEGRVLPQARKMHELREETGPQIPELQQIEVRPKELSAPEFSELPVETESDS